MAPGVLYAHKHGRVRTTFAPAARVQQRLRTHRLRGSFLRQALHSHLDLVSAAQVIPVAQLLLKRLACRSAEQTDERARSRVPVTKRRIVTLLCTLPACAIPAHGLAAAYDVNEVKQRIVNDFVQKQYYVTGELDSGLFDQACQFKDPTTTLTGVKAYVAAVSTLFDPARSRADLISVDVESQSSILLRWRLEGALQLGGLSIKPYTGTTRYTLNTDGKVVKHEETWDISIVDAFVSTLIPSFGAPAAPPVSELVKR